MSRTNRMLDKRIVDLLQTMGQVPQDILDQAVEQQQRSGEHIVDILIRDGRITEREVATIMCNHFQRPFLSTRAYDIEAGVMQLVPPQLLIEHQMVILDKFVDTLLIAIAMPVRSSIIDSLREVTGCEPEMYISLLSDIRFTLQQNFPDYYDPTTNMPQFDTTGAFDGSLSQIIGAPEESRDTLFEEGFQDDLNWEMLFEEAEQKVLDDLEDRYEKSTETDEEVDGSVGAV